MIKMTEKEKEMAYKAFVNEDCKLELHKTKGSIEPGFIFRGSSNSLVMMLHKLFVSVITNNILTPDMIQTTLDLTVKTLEENKDESK